jgi:hypothetical protein
MHFTDWRLTTLLLFGLVLVGAESLAQAQDQPQTMPPIETLIEQLGDSAYVRREEATSRLTEIGIPAKAALSEAARHADAEVRHRALRILAVILEADFERRLREFAEDVDGGRGLTLPGWERFSARLGGDRASRQLFVDIQRSEPELMLAYAERPKQLSQIFEVRSAALQQSLQFQNGSVGQEITLGSITGLLLVASEPDVTISTQAGQLMYSFIHRPSFQTAVAGGAHKESLLNLLGAWIGNDGQRNTSVDYQKVLLAMRFDLKQGLPLGLATAKQAGAPPYYRLYGMLAVAKLGSRDNLDELESMLTDDTVCTKRKVQDKEITIEVRDAALLAMLHLTGQEPKEYGFDQLQANDQYLYNPTSLFVDDNKTREAAQAKWKAWREKNDE